MKNNIIQQIRWRKPSRRFPRVGLASIGLLVVAAYAGAARPVTTPTVIRSTPGVSGSLPVSPSERIAFTMRIVRVLVAEDGTKREEVLGTSVSRSTTNVRITSGYGNITFEALPQINRDKSIHLNLNIRNGKNNVPDPLAFIQKSRLPLLRNLRADQTVCFAATAEVTDQRVLDALRQEKTLPATGNAYSVIFMYASARCLPISKKS